jgi:ABC-type bacteriocin/lantibiotic exporter with double-glycine peptidase domain
MLVVSAFVIYLISPSLLWVAIVIFAVFSFFAISGVLLATASDKNESTLKNSLCEKCKTIYQFYVDECE